METNDKQYDDLLSAIRSIKPANGNGGFLKHLMPLWIFVLGQLVALVWLLASMNSTTAYNRSEVEKLWIQQKAIEVNIQTLREKLAAAGWNPNTNDKQQSEPPQPHYAGRP